MGHPRPLKTARRRGSSTSQTRRTHTTQTRPTTSAKTLGRRLARQGRHAVQPPKAPPSGARDRPRSPPPLPHPPQRLRGHSPDSRAPVWHGTDHPGRGHRDVPEHHRLQALFRPRRTHRLDRRRQGHVVQPGLSGQHPPPGNKNLRQRQGERLQGQPAVREPRVRDHARAGRPDAHGTPSAYLPPRRRPVPAYTSGAS